MEGIKQETLIESDHSLLAKTPQDDFLLSFINSDFCSESCGINEILSKKSSQSPRDKDSMLSWSSSSSDAENSSSPPTPPSSDVNLENIDFTIDDLLKESQNGLGMDYNNDITNDIAIDSVLPSSIKVEDIASLIDFVNDTTPFDNNDLKTSNISHSLSQLNQIFPQPVLAPAASIHPKPLIAKSNNISKPIAPIPPIAQTRPIAPANNIPLKSSDVRMVTPPPSSTACQQKLTPEQKKQERLIKNRAAALNSRKRKREQFAQMEQTVDKMKEENDQLKSELEKYKNESTKWQAERKSLINERDALKKKLASLNPQAFDMDLENNNHSNRDDKSNGKSPGTILMIMLFSFALFNLPSMSSLGRLTIGGSNYNSQKLIGPTTNFFTKSLATISPTDPNVENKFSSVSPSQSQWQSLPKPSTDLIDIFKIGQERNFGQAQIGDSNFTPDVPDAYIFCDSLVRGLIPSKNGKLLSDKPSRITILSPVVRKDIIPKESLSKELIVPRRQLHWSTSAARRRAKKQTNGSTFEKSDADRQYIWRRGGNSDQQVDYLLRLDVDVLSSNLVPKSDVDLLGVSWSTFGPEDDLDQDNNEKLVKDLLNNDTDSVGTNNSTKKRVWNIAGRP